jgi:hypothetical protein
VARTYGSVRGITPQIIAAALPYSICMELINRRMNYETGQRELYRYEKNFDSSNFKKVNQACYAYHNMYF